MSRLLRTFAILAVALTCVTVSSCEQIATTVARPVQAEAREEISFTGRVVGITDGDTVKVLDAHNKQYTVRLAEIDAPERGQPWGNRSKETLSSLVMNETVSVQQTDTDRYGRVVARVFRDGEDINRALVELGAAWAFRRYLTDETLIATEQHAKSARLGLWSMSETQTIAPWEWRRGVRVAQAAPAEQARVADAPRGLLLRPNEEPVQTVVAEGAGFSCLEKRFCRQMTSCEEAHFYLRQCGVSSLDGNSDGEPCEVLCGTTSR